ncbi:remodeling and spacing factor 1 isoform X1 [Gadus macrocephalus]|uniref:remodeling and spacing factor 1 isoform X1 n=1 Tax=Gadus macrocephalus TaxID=80720 RepID=UPI0028CBA047|nr:remodeling and spacing factor 1 isoform X1 [Gadus macrocephalus]
MAAPAAAPSSGPDLCPSFAVVCGFMERYGQTLDLPEISFPQMERYLRETSTVPQPLVDLHVKLLRKLGKSVTSDRWEKYLAKVCQELNSSWAWELEQNRYMQMSMESKSTILKYLCECQFDDNLKFKAVVNDEEPEKMRLQPIGRDWQGLLYWLQLDPEQNIRLYTEEQDDLDGSSWRCIVRNRTDLAEALDLLKSQIDPNHNKTKTEEGSASGNPEGEEKTGTGEDADHLKKEGDSGDHLANTNLSEPPKATDEKPNETADLKTEEPLQPAVKQEEAGLVKQEAAGLVKQEEMEVDLKAQPSDLPADRKSPASCLVIDNRVSTITAIIKPESRDLDVPSVTPSNAVSVVMAPASVITKQEVNREEEAERAVVRSSQQAKIPLKKRELKLAEAFQDNRNHLNNNNKGSSIIVCNPSVIQSKDGVQAAEGKLANSLVPHATSEENAPQPELTNGKAALLPVPPPLPHKEGGQNGVIGVIGQVGVIGHVGVIRSPMERPRGPGAEPQERNGPGEEGAEGRRRPEDVGRWEEEEEEKEREGNRQSVLVRKRSVDVEAEAHADAEAPRAPSPPPPATPSPPLPVAGAVPRETGAQGEEPQKTPPTEGERAAKEEQEAAEPEKEPPVKTAEPADPEPEAAAAQPAPGGDAADAQGRERPAGPDTQAKPGPLEVASSELQKEGIRLKIKIPPHKRSKKKGREEKEREAEHEALEEDGRSLRRSARICRSSALPICRPSSKVAESQDKSGQKTGSKDGEEEEEEEEEEQEEEEGQKPAVKKDQKTDPNWLGRKPKGKRRHRRPRWSTPRSKRRRLAEEGEGGERGKGQKGEESEGGRDSGDSSESEELPMEDACSQCGLPNHPELILLCDSCDNGYHTACLRPPLMLIPDGEWFCPPCQHKLLCERLEEQLLNLDSNLKKRERALRRKERLVYVGISVENIIPEGDVEPSAEKSEKKKDSKKSSKNLGRRSTRTRKCISYRFDDFDDAIDEAIEEDVGDVYGGAGAVRGKDINTILSDEGKQAEQPIKSQARLARSRKRRRLNDLESDSTAAESEEEFMLSNSSEEEEFAAEEDEEGEDDEDGGSDAGSDASGRRPKRGAPRTTAGRTARGHKRKTQKHRAKRPRRRRPRSSEEEEGETEEEMDSDWSSDMSDSEADRKRKGLRRGQRQQVNYRETSESSDNSGASANKSKENKPRLKPRRQRLSSDYSDSSASSRGSDEEDDAEGGGEERGGPRRRGGGRKRRRGEEEERPRKSRQGSKKRRADADDDEEDRRRRLKRRRLAAAAEEEERERRKRRMKRRNREEEEEEVEEEKMGRGRRREILSKRRQQRLAQMLKKRRPSTDDDSDRSEDSQDSDSSSEEDRPVRKRLNRIDSDDDDEEEDDDDRGDEEEKEGDKESKDKKPSERESRVAGGDGERGDEDDAADEEDGAQEKPRSRSLSPTDKLSTSRGLAKPGPGSPTSPRDSAGSDKLSRHNGPLPPEKVKEEDGQTDLSNFVPNSPAS